MTKRQVLDAIDCIASARHFGQLLYMAGENLKDENGDAITAGADRMLEELDSAKGLPQDDSPVEPADSND